MPLYRICRCGRRLPRGKACNVCENARNRARRDGVQSPAWRRLSALILKEHRTLYGDVCPGDETHEEHSCRDLTCDHIQPLAKGGPLLDRENIRVLCRSRNSGKRDRV